VLSWLTAEQRAVLRRWISEGAPYALHWAFIPPRRSEVPAVKFASWPRNAIDYFILERLERAGLSPSPETDRGHWLRRVTLDLTGLPPTPEELERFLAEDSSAAYEAVVDRLLSSPSHAERMAMQWLDVARYADTNGYNNDETRSMWPWRDWVIDAFARNLPYDQFLTEQLAGDLLPNPTLAQRVATGFNRNHVLTTEEGIIEEEYHVEYVADRVHTAATAFLGLSMQCARCHDHKFDPITQREYYQFAAFFANLPDKAVNYRQGKMAEPLLPVPSAEQQEQLTQLNNRRQQLERLSQERLARADGESVAWEHTLAPSQINNLAPDGLIARLAFDEPAGSEVVDAVDPKRHGEIRGHVSRGPGKLGAAVEFDGSTSIEFKDIGSLGSEHPFSLSAWIQPTSTDPITVLSKMDEADAYRGYDIILEAGRVACHLVHRWPDDALKVITKSPIELNSWHHVVVSYDGSRRATGIRIYVDGKLQSLEIVADTLVGTIRTDKPFRIGQRQTSDPFKGWIDDVQIYDANLSAAQATALAAGKDLVGRKQTILTPPAQRSEQQRQLLRQYYLDQVDTKWQQAQSELAEVREQIENVQSSIPVTMVMQELTPPRPTFVLNRGKYDQPVEEVKAGVPRIVASLPTDAPANRLALARSLTAPQNPLTARVAVNRLWEMLFGTGIVETSADFGVQGAFPSHPELLDWLATELIQNGWNQRAILKQIVLSATYRQSSDISPKLLEADPHNRLLARGPRNRLPAETIRDSALAVSGLLRRHVGGPSVFPYQPAGLWEEISVEHRARYVADTGAGLYRRSLYTFWKRTCPPPALATFDAPDRETCVMRRGCTNTPLQALVLLNDPTYVEAARKLAERILTSAKTNEERLDVAYRLVLCRTPEKVERQLLQGVYFQAMAHFKAAPDAAQKLLKVGQSSYDSACDAVELAAWTTVMSMLLNLDEAISKT
jgi:hypothetical protein